jgi:hypothetical protein
MSQAPRILFLLERGIDVLVVITQAAGILASRAPWAVSNR